MNIPNNLVILIICMGKMVKVMISLSNLTQIETQQRIRIQHARKWCISLSCRSDWCRNALNQADCMLVVSMGFLPFRWGFAYTPPTECHNIMGWAVFDGWTNVVYFSSFHIHKPFSALRSPLSLMKTSTLCTKFVYFDGPFLDVTHIYFGVCCRVPSYDP